MKCLECKKDCLDDEQFCGNDCEITYLQGQVEEIEAKRVEQVKGLRHEIRIMQLSLEEKNKELDAMHYVWCYGCDPGIHRFGEHPEITLDLIRRAQNGVQRLMIWYSNHLDRQVRELKAEEEKMKTERIALIRQAVEEAEG